MNVIYVQTWRNQKRPGLGTHVIISYAAQFRRKKRKKRPPERTKSFCLRQHCSLEQWLVASVLLLQPPSFDLPGLNAAICIPAVTAAAAYASKAR